MELAAVAAAKVKFVTGETDRNVVPRFPFAWSVVIGRGGLVLSGIDHTAEVDHDRAANRVSE